MKIKKRMNNIELNILKTKLNFKILSFEHLIEDVNEHTDRTILGIFIRRDIVYFVDIQHANEFMEIRVKGLTAVGELSLFNRIIKEGVTDIDSIASHLNTLNTDFIKRMTVYLNSPALYVEPDKEDWFRKGNEVENEN